MTFDGTRRWAAPKEGVFKWDSTLVADPKSLYELDKWIIDATACLEPYSEKIGGTDFKLSAPRNLTDFINWNVENYPARKYILLMKDHGSGWDFYDDRTTTSTRAQIFDDLFDAGSSEYGLSISDAVEGIKSSTIHKVDAIISDECLMATMEVLNEYAAVTDLNMAAQENTRSQYGNHILEAFKKGAKNGKPLKDILRSCADRYVEAYDYDTQAGFMSDQGVYDLTKIFSLNTPVKSVVRFFAEKEGNADREKVKLQALGNTLCASSMRDFFYLYIDTQEMMKHSAELSDDERSAALANIAIINQLHSGFCLYDFLSNVVTAAQTCNDVSAPADFARELETFKSYLYQYDRALREMAYINCTSKQTADDPYRYTSPSVILQSLKEGVYGPVTAQNIYGYPNADKMSREDALASYRRLTFDRETDWSAFLVRLQKSATPFEGGDRMFRNGIDY